MKRIAGAGVLAAVSPILFYAILFRHLSNLPHLDDYEALLDFVNHIAASSSVSAKASYFLGAQYNEYKLLFEHGLVWLQFVVFAHINLSLLCVIGNGCVLLLAVLLWKMFLPEHEFADRLGFFIPVTCLLFQLQYVETLDWAMASLQNLPVVVFSLATIYLLVRPTRKAFCMATSCLILAVASSGNGLIMIPLGVLILARGRHYWRVAGWLALSVGCLTAYAFHYDVLASQSRHHQSILSTMLHPRALYVIAFIGSAASSPVRTRSVLPKVLLCLLLGSILCVFWGYMARRGYGRKNPLVSYCVLFLFLTAIGVAGLRSDIGIVQSLSSRYGIYSALFVIFAWFAIVEEFLQHKSSARGRNRILFTAIAAAALFSVIMDVRGWQYLVERNREIVLGMKAFEHPVSPNTIVGPVLPIPNQSWRFDELDRRAPIILRESTKLAVYQPPPL